MSGVQNAARTFVPTNWGHCFWGFNALSIGFAGHKWLSPLCGDKLQSHGFQVIGKAMIFPRVTLLSVCSCGCRDAAFDVEEWGFKSFQAPAAFMVLKLGKKSRKCLVFSRRIFLPPVFGGWGGKAAHGRANHGNFRRKGNTKIRQILATIVANNPVNLIF
jgi:hypothetical protein